MRYCGVDISAKPANQQLVTLHERRAPEGGVELVATFYAPGTSSRWRARSRASAAAARSSPSTRRPGPRRDLLGAGAPLRAELGLPDGRYERMRVCDALLFRRGLPLYPVPAAAQSPQGWEEWIGVGFELFAALAGLGLYKPERADGWIAPVGVGRAALRAAVRDLPGRDLLRPARPPPVAQADAVGPAAADRGAADEGRPGRRRRALAPHARRARRVRGGLRRLRARRRARALGRRAGRGRDRPAGRRAARPLRQAPAARPARRWPDDAPTLGVVEKTRSGRTTQSRYTPPPREARAKQRAYVVGAFPEGDLDELKELLRTSGAAVVGELIQRRDQPHPNLYLGPGKVEELKALIKQADANLVACDDELTPRQERNLEKELGDPGPRPDRGHPRHLRRPRAQRRGQAAGRARAARVQHGPHARALDAPRASRRRPRRRRHRHPGPGRVADRDRPPARARPDHRAAPPARRRPRDARDPARRARARAPAERRARRATRTPASRRC